MIFLSFAIPLAILYYVDAQSFEKTWKGRTFYMFFIWLFIIELILNWEKYKLKTVNKPNIARIIILGAVLTLPTVYVIIANFCSLNAGIIELARQYGMEPTWADSMPLSIEYLVFTILYALIILLAYGWSGLKDFSLSAAIPGAIGAIYIIDNFYPYGSFTPFQIFVQPTATLAANVLNLMGYQTRFLPPEMPGVPNLVAWNSVGYTNFGIAWPCSGVESLLIYTVTILLFLRKSAISWIQKIIYFVIGAGVTYLINILRIVTIFVISINTGGGYTPQAKQFHEFLGPFYSIIWIVAYPLIIIGSGILWSKIRGKRQELPSKGIES